MAKILQEKSEQLPMAPLPSYKFGKAYPQLIGSPVLFTWKNPLTGMFYDKKERYAKFDQVTGEPPRLITIKLKKDVKILNVYTFGDTGEISEKISVPHKHKVDFSKYDVIQYFFFGSGKKAGAIIWNDYVVINSRGVEYFNADPDYNGELRKQVKKIKQPKFKYKREEVYGIASFETYNDPQLYKKYVLPIAESVLENGTKGIHPTFYQGKKMNLLKVNTDSFV